MANFSALPDEDRWALAFYVGSLSYNASDRAAGAKLWRSDEAIRQTINGLDALTQLTEQALAERLGDASAQSVTAYLRHNPRALAEQRPRSTSIAMSKINESVAAVRTGDRPAAVKLALAAYLDGFEPAEPALATRDRVLFETIESRMTAYRKTIASGSVQDVEASAQTLRQLLVQADTVLAPSDNDAATTFLGALTILLREGLEALLVIVAMIAFLKKAQRSDVLVYVHAGWAAALAAGGITWAVATYLVGASGASRELTEGFSSLFAAAVLLGIGMWMHQKSLAGRWQVYLKEKLSSALTRRTAWFLFSLAFIAVYREVFETVLFYTALWTDGNGWPLIAGLTSGAALLGIVAAVLLRTSARLPIGSFFSASSFLVAALCLVLTGKGIAGLQEAGLVQASPIAIPRITFLGIYPTWQTLLVQMSMLIAIALTFMIIRRSGSKILDPKHA